MFLSFMNILENISQELAFTIKAAIVIFLIMCFPYTFCFMIIGYVLGGTKWIIFLLIIGIILDTKILYNNIRINYVNKHRP